MNYICQATKKVYKLTQHSNDITVNYFKLFKNAQKVS